MYNIPIVPQNLRRDEMVVQTVDALIHLSNISNEIFSRINQRIETNAVHLASIRKRIESAQLKISKLRGAKKATQVFSSSKYPANVYHSYMSAFTNDHNVLLSCSKFKYKDIQFKDESLEPLQFYHIKVENKESEISAPKGLGDIPEDITAINDILLYNTGKNPYSDYVISDPLQSSAKLKKQLTQNVSHIGAPPHSLVERATLTKPTTDSYLYLPDLGNVPIINVPLDLPDLPGIADDLRYTDRAGPGIAPSVTTTPLAPDLPTLIQNTDNYNSSFDLQNISSETTIPGLQEIPEEFKEEDIKEVKHMENVNLELQSNITSLPVVNDAHANLMEAIRKAGGVTNGQVKMTEPKKQPTGDLMADLHAKLSLRRKGISGIKNPDISDANSNSLDSNTTMQKISAMIPPPPIKIDQSDSTNTEDEDWDD